MKKNLKAVAALLLSSLFILLTACNNGGGGGSSGSSPIGAVSKDYPYLLSAPRVTFIESVMYAGQYDVRVELDATGPNPIYAVNLWIKSADSSDDFAHLDLQYVGGTTWSAQTNQLLPLPPGNYYLDSITIDDADVFAEVPVKTGWYFINELMSNTHYFIDQRLVDPNSSDFLYNAGLSNIPIVRFKLP